MGDLLEQLLAWDQAGPVAILMFVLVCLGYIAFWLLRQLIRDKDVQITRLTEANDVLLEVGRTVDLVLTTVKTLAERRRDR